MNLLALIGIFVLLSYVGKRSRQTVDVLSRIALFVVVLSMAGVVDLTPINGCLTNIKLSEIISRFE